VREQAPGTSGHPAAVMSERMAVNSAEPWSAPSKSGRKSPLRAVAAMFRLHGDLVRNALSLLATTGVTSGIGFAYWDVAARLFTQQSVGYSAAAISVMTLLSWIGIFGFGTLLIGELPRRDNGLGLVSAGVIASGLGSLILTIGFVLIVPHFTASFDDVTDSLVRAALLCAAVVLTAMTLVLDSATIGLLRGGLQLARNITFVIVKMLTLIAAATVMHNALGIGIFLSWIVAIPISLVPIIFRLWLSGRFVLPKPDWAALRSLSRPLLAHNWLNLAIQVPSLLIPVIVASIMPASVNAGFYAAWTIANLLYFLPTHLSTVLFAVASGDPRALAPKLRFTLRVSFFLGIPGMAVLILGAHFILGIFGQGYTQVAALPMQLVVLGYIPAIPKLYYIAVCRSLGRISRAAIIETSFAALEIAGAIVGCLRGGLVGLVIALLVVGTLEAMVTLPAVLRAAWGGGRHRQARQLAPMAARAELARDDRQGVAGVDSREAQVRKQAQQRAALAVLMSLAVPAPSAIVAFEQGRPSESGKAPRSPGAYGAGRGVSAGPASRRHGTGQQRADSLSRVRPWRRPP